MNLIDLITNAQNGGQVQQLARKFNLPETDVTNAIGQFLPALTNGVKKNIAQDGGLDSLFGALNQGGHDRYLDNPSAFDSNDAETDGNGILGHLFGDKQVSRELAGRAAQKTGVDSGILKKMLPFVASMAMGALTKRTGEMGMLGGQAPSSSSLGPLASLLDADGDGSMVDDLLGMAGKFLR